MLLLGLLKLFLVLIFIENVFPAPAPSRTVVPDQQIQESKLLEIKLPVKITSMEDLVAWARNAMRSMASRIDITLASVDENDTKKSDFRDSSPISDDSKRKKSNPVSTNYQNRGRTVASGALVSTYASLLQPQNSFETFFGGDNELIRQIPRGNVNAYLPLLLDETAISRYREEALRKFYRENEQVKQEEKKQEKREREAGKYSQVIARETSKVSVDNNVASSAEKTNKDENKPRPIISVPFEAIVTITRENVPEPTRNSLIETRDPPDDFPPYFDTNKDPPRQKDQDKYDSSTTNAKDKSQKRQISTLGDLLRLLGLTKKINTKKGDVKGEKETNSQKNTRPRKPSEKFTPPPLIQFEEQPPRQRRNETSQKQEFDDDDEDEEEDEESMGSLGSITDLLPLVIPILQDISDPNTETDLGEVLQAAIPLIQGLSDPDEDQPDILGMIGPILMKILGGKDGEGSDVAAVLGPAITLIAPLIGPVLGPVIGPLLAASSNPPQGEGSNLATLLTAVIAPLTQPTGPGGMSPLSVLTAQVIAALSKELKPGLPGGLDVGAVVGSVLSGVIAGTSAGLSGGSQDTQQYQPYGPYGTGPVQAGSANIRTSTGPIVSGSQVKPPQQRVPTHHQQVPVPQNSLDPRIVHRTTHRPYVTLPQTVLAGPPPRPPPPLHQNYVQHHATGPQPAGTGTGDSSYLPYGNNGVPANSVNPFGLIGSSIKDILGAGVQVVSSVINAVFGIIGASSSSSDEPRPAYGPPPAAPYAQSIRQK